MSVVDNLVKFIPEVVRPTEKVVSFGTKMKWTGFVLLAYFILAQINLFGVAESALEQFEAIAVLIGAKFGTLMSLGVGPIVTASIILQLLNGSGVLSYDTSTAEGKRKFQSLQRLLAFSFIIGQSIIYVALGGLSPNPIYAGTSTYFTLQVLITIQLFIGGFLIMLMDDLVQKWGLGSGIGLFIVAGVSQQVMIRFFSWFTPEGSEYAVGAVWALIQSIQAGDMNYAVLTMSGIFFTILVIGISIFVQSMKVEIPLSFGRVRGHAIRWPLNFMYTGVIPVILIAALLANIQIAAQLLSNAFPSINAEAVQAFVSAPNLVPAIIQSQTIFIGWMPYLQFLSYFLIFLVGCIVFSWFWVQSANMDARSQAKNIMKSGLQMPGFRKDPRVMEKVLNRYINPLTIMGAITIAILAVLADVTGSFSSGTGLLLVVMILYKMYQDIAKQHMSDFNPQMRNLFGGN